MTGVCVQAGMSHQQQDMIGECVVSSMTQPTLIGLLPPVLTAVCSGVAGAIQAAEGLPQGTAAAGA